MTFIVICSAAIGVEAYAEEPLSVTIYDYPPDVVNAATNPSGTHVKQLLEITEKAGFSVQWLQSNMAEESSMLDDGRRPFCTTGRAYSTERAQKWRYVPYLFDGMDVEVLVARPEVLEALLALETPEAMTRAKDFKGVFIKGGYYSSSTGETLNLSTDWLLDIASSELQGLKMIVSGRADYTFLPMETWFAEKYRDLSLQALKTAPLALQRGGTPVLIACSQAVPETIIERLSVAMQSLGYPEYR